MFLEKKKKRNVVFADIIFRVSNLHGTCSAHMTNLKGFKAL